MSEVDICRLAYEGKMKEIDQMIQTNPESLLLCDQSGRNALHWAACGGHLGLVKWLISKGIDKETSDRSDWTPLMIAVSAGRQDVVAYLITDVNANVNIINSTGQCPLHYAASKNRLEVAKLLLDAKANVDVRDWAENTPLHRAISLGHLDMAKLLLDRGPAGLINAKDSEGKTVLHYACSEDSMSAIRLCLEYGASLSCKDKAGNTPIDLCSDTFRVKAQKYFESVDTG